VPNHRAIRNATILYGYNFYLRVRTLLHGEAELRLFLESLKAELERMVRYAGRYMLE